MASYALVLFSPRLRLLLTVALLASTCLRIAAADDTQVLFDIPDAIECREVTPEKFGASHPDLKVIEAKLRISARFGEGAESDVVDFLYMVASPGLRLKIEDYLPNTTLESTVQGDQIEIADSSESSKTTGEDAHINYKVLGLGGTASQGSKKTESSHYKEIAAKALVMASGTTNREHGVFYKLKPSKAASLEGAKEFTFLAIVPKTWRGDWCVVSCAARAKKKSFFGNSIAVAGVEQAHVGMYLAGDREARFRAEELCEVQQARAGEASTLPTDNAGGVVQAMHAATGSEHSDHSWLHQIFGGSAGSAPANQQNIPEADGADVAQKRTSTQKQMMDVEERLRRLSGARF